MENHIDDYIIKALLCDVHNYSDIILMLKYGHAEAAVVFEKGKPYFLNCGGYDYLKACSKIKLWKDASIEELIEQDIIFPIKTTGEYLENVFYSGTTFVFWLKFNANHCDVSYFDSVCRIDDSINNYKFLNDVLNHLIENHTINDFRLKYVHKEYYYNREDSYGFRT